MSIFGWVKFSIQNVVLTISRRKRAFFPAGPFFRVFLTKWLLKCLNSIKPPLPCRFLVARLHWEITLKKSVSQTKRKCDSLVLSRSYLSMEWRFHVIPRVHCCHFCLEPTVRRDAWLRTTSVTVMVILFERNILKVTWSQLCSKFLLKIYKEHWQQHFERYPTVK